MKRGTPRGPKVFDLMRIAKVRRNAAVGWLELLWHATADFAPQGNIGRCSDEWIEAQLDWGGKNGKLIAMLVDSKWIDLSNEWRLLVHDWHEHADDSVRKRLARSGLPFLTVTPEVTVHCPDTDRKVSATLPDNGSLPKPEPKPEPKPVSTRETDADLSGLARTIWTNHPKHRRPAVQAVERALAQIAMESTDPGGTAAKVCDRHAGWAASEEWRRDGCRYVPNLLRWLDPRNGGWMTDPPEADDGLNETERACAELLHELKDHPGGLQ